MKARTNLRIFLRIQFVLNKEELSDSSGFRALSLLYGMQGVSGSSPLGSIERSQVQPWFLKTDPEWSSKVKEIWLWDEYPHRWGLDL